MSPRRSRYRLPERPLKPQRRVDLAAYGAIVAVTLLVLAVPVRRIATSTIACRTSGRSTR